MEVFLGSAAGAECQFGSSPQAWRSAGRSSRQPDRLRVVSTEVEVFLALGAEYQLPFRCLHTGGGQPVATPVLAIVVISSSRRWRSPEHLKTNGFRCNIISTGWRSASVRGDQPQDYVVFMGVEVSRRSTKLWRSWSRLHGRGGLPRAGAAQSDHANSLHRRGGRPWVRKVMRVPRDRSPRAWRYPLRTLGARRLSGLFSTGVEVFRANTGQASLGAAILHDSGGLPSLTT